MNQLNKKHIARAKKSWWLRVLTRQIGPLDPRYAVRGPEIPGLAKKGPFFHDFSEVLENFRPKTRRFFAKFQFPRGVPRVLTKFNEKMGFGGVF